MINPILILKQECRECKGISTFYLGKICSFCKGIGWQETKIYTLRDFEKLCPNVIEIEPNAVNKMGFQHKGDFESCIYKCDKGFITKIPFKSYKIKKVSEIELDERPRHLFLEEHNLKEDDKVVITNNE